MPYTILQPAALMQNLMMSRDSLVKEGVFFQKFFVSNATRINLVDLDDVAEIAAKVLIGSEYEYATYEICGPQNLSLSDMLATFESLLCRPIQSVSIQDEAFAAQLRKRTVRRSH